jgi:hypothetical protein
MSDRTKAPQPVLLGEHSAIRLVGLAWSVYVKNYPAILVIFSAMFLPFCYFNSVNKPGLSLS